MPDTQSQGQLPAGSEFHSACVEAPESLSWYALQVRPRYEKFVAEMLTNKGVDRYLPLYSVRRAWSDRLQTVEFPLFPGYVFCRLDWRDRNAPPVLTTPGVVRILGVGREPSPVNQAEIDAVKLIAESGRAVRPWSAALPGDRVLIECGPFAGIEGVLVRSKKNCRLVVSVSILNRSIAVEIEEEWARPAAPYLRRTVSRAKPSWCAAN